MRSASGQGAPRLSAPHLTCQETCQACGFIVTQRRVWRGILDAVRFYWLPCGEMKLSLQQIQQKPFSLKTKLMKGNSWGKKKENWFRILPRVATKRKRKCVWCRSNRELEVVFSFFLWFHFPVWVTSSHLQTGSSPVSHIAHVAWNENWE